MNTLYISIKTFIDFIINFIGILTWIVRKNFNENGLLELIDENSRNILYSICNSIFYLYFYIIHFNKINKLKRFHIHFLKEKNAFVFQNDIGTYIDLNMKDLLFKKLEYKIDDVYNYDNGYIEFFDYYIRFLNLDELIKEIIKENDPIYYYSKVNV